MKLFSYLLFCVNFIFTLIPVYGQVIVHQENFNAGIGTWSAVDVSDPTDVWSAAAGAMQINGIGGAADEDWLISPAINMNAQDNEYFMFDYYDVNSGPLIEVFYSTNYSNAGTSASVIAATWISIPLRILDMNTISCVSTGVFQRHPAIDVSGINGVSVYFAFKYTGSSAVSKNYQIDNVRIVGDYYGNLSGTTNCAPLKQELHDLITVQYDRIRYTSSSLYDVWDAFLHTDTRLNDAGTATIVWDMFTDIPSATGEFEFNHCIHRDGGSCPGGEGVCYNREHSFPVSWWGGGTTLSDTIYTDLHHIYPSDRQMNIVKSNYPPGNVLVPSSTGSNGFTMGANATYPCVPSTGAKNYFEPIDDYKGDYARTYFYVVTRYQHNMLAWQGNSPQGACFMDGSYYPSLQPWALQTLLEWHAADPVSQKEIDRNNAVFAIQGNRNPYIDNPGYVYLVWGDEFGTPCSSVVLPVELIKYEVNLHNAEVDIEWSTATEINSDYFLIERSSDLNNWTVIDKVKSIGTSQIIQHYGTVDRTPESGVYYYRLRQVDRDGIYHYYGVRSIVVDSEIMVYPNPTTGVVMMTGAVDIDDEPLLFDVYGRLIRSVEIDRVGKDRILIDLSNLPTDLYFIYFGEHTFKIIKTSK